jgi:hypothetical protein
MDQAKRPGRTEALKRINTMRKESRRRLTVHWRLRAKQRDFDEADFRAVCQTGRIDDEGEWDDTHRNWKFRIVGYDVEHCEFIVVVGLADDELILISGMRKVAGQWEEE